MGIEALPVAEEKVEKSDLTRSSNPERNPRAKGIPKDVNSTGTRTTIVFGEGNKKGPTHPVGEGPGYEEDVQERPFVGRAGQLLTKIIQSIHLEREEDYILNII